MVPVAVPLLALTVAVVSDSQCSRQKMLEERGSGRENAGAHTGSAVWWQHSQEEWHSGSDSTGTGKEGE